MRGLRVAALALASLLLTLAAAELALRAFTPASFLQRRYGGFGVWRVYDPVRSWTNRPGYRDEHLRINALQLRGEEISRRKPPGVFRIACLGDSATFGVWRVRPGVFGYDSYPAELARLLTEAGHRRVEVLNAGVVGYSSSHGLRQLAVGILELEPDVVTVRFGMNDHSVSNAPALRAREPRSELARALLYRFHGWRLVRLFLGVYQRIPFFHPEPNTVLWATPQELEYNLRRFAELSREHGFRLLFLDYPLRALERGESPGDEGDVVLYAMLGARNLKELHRVHREAQAVARLTAEREGVPWLETAPFLVGSDPPSYSDYDLVHPNDVGARAIARRLFESLQDWLPRPDPGPPR